MMLTIAATLAVVAGVQTFWAWIGSKVAKVSAETEWHTGAYITSLILAAFWFVIAVAMLAVRGLFA